MKYCEDFAALLDPYIDGELSPEETARVREHLRSCDGCRAYVQAALTMRDAFPEAEDTEVPEGFAEGVMAAIRADAAPRKRRRPRWQKTLLPLAACCAVVILAVSGLPRRGDNAIDTADSTRQAERQMTLDTEDAPSDTAAPNSLAELPETDSTAVNPSTAEGAAESAPETESAAPATQNSDPSVAAAAGNTQEQGTAAAEASDPAASLTPYTVRSAPGLTLTAEEAGQLLDGYTPTAREDGTLLYELTASEYTALLEQLEQQGMTVAGAATAQEAETAGTVWVYVIPE